jgi:hypothetical protein
MKTIYRTVSFILIFVVGLNTQMFGWGSIGHMAVGYVAYGQLNPGTKDRVNALLKLNPDYKKWLTLIPEGTSAKDQQMMIFMIAATWPDQIKSETGYTDDGPDPKGNRPDGDTSKQNIGYSDHLHHKYWHFVDTPFTQDGTPLGSIPTPNAGTQITAFRKVLSSNKPDELKSYDLVWLLHLVGDVHQPLHARRGSARPIQTGTTAGTTWRSARNPAGASYMAFGTTFPAQGRA